MRYALKGLTEWKASRGWTGGQVNFETASGVFVICEADLSRSQLGELKFPSGILIILAKRCVSRTFSFLLSTASQVCHSDGSNLRGDLQTHICS